MNEPLPPFSVEAEASVLGAMLLSQKAVETCAEILDGREFYKPSNERIFRAITGLFMESKTVDTITVAERASEDSEQVYDLGASLPTTTNAGHYAQIVRDTWVARQLVLVGNEIQRLGYEKSPIAEVVGLADERMLEVQSLLERKSDTVYTGKQLMERLRTKVENPEDDSTGVASPFPMMHRLKAGRMYVLGGAMKMGKTALALQFLRAACEGGSRVGFCSIEMSKDDLADRLVSTFGVPHRQVMTGNIESVYRGVFDEATKEVEEWDFEVVDDPDVNAITLRRAQRRGKYDLLIIDHLHRIPIKDPRHERQELEENVRQITNIARNFEIPVLLLAQLTPGPAHDPYPRPSISSLRATRAIGMEAATVWFIWRKADQFHNPGTDAELLCALNRFGDTGYMELKFDRQFVRFE